MDTLADIASRQQSQHDTASRPHSQRAMRGQRESEPPGLAEAQDRKRNRPQPRRGHTLAQLQTAPEQSAYHQHSRSFSHLRSGPGTPGDREVGPKSFTSKSLSDEDSALLGQLWTHLQSSPMDYRSYVTLIEILQRGLDAHMQQNPSMQSFELLTDLRQAREAMNQHFPVGEDMWSRWLAEEMRLATSLEKRIDVVELFGRAVSDEPSSPRLWRLYGDYMYSLWLAANGQSPEAETWDPEEQSLGREVFGWDNVTKTWESALERTRSDIRHGNQVWDRYMEILLEDLARRPTGDKIFEIQQRFETRLSKQPHESWDNTFQMFSSFMSTYNKNSYETAMMEMSSKSASIKEQYAHRDPFEMQIVQAKHAADVTSEWLTYSKYLEWEITTKGVFSLPLIVGLFERAITRFPTDQTLWLDYVEFLTQNTQQEGVVQDVTERATRHCPWSGDLWAHRILALEESRRDFREIEDVKHAATTTGLLNTGDHEELIKVYIAWCGCLRRRAFEPGASDDAVDIADLGITAALDYIKDMGPNGPGAQASPAQQFVDPHYRLERIYIKFLTQRGDVAACRKQWFNLIELHKNSYDFWYRYYIWEMVVWAKFAMRARNEPENQLQTPRDATAVLHAALQHRKTIDRPDELLQMFLNHCEQHESVRDFRLALIAARKMSKEITQRQAEEARRAEEAAAASAASAQALAAEQSAATSDKRKREGNEEDSESYNKRVRVDHEPSLADQQAAEPAPTRDRENTTIIVDGLPSDVQEKRIRQFFRDCGTIKAITIHPSDEAASATIEFEDIQDAMYAESKTSKPFDGRSIQVRQTLGATLFVTNYPADADQAYLRELFEPYGEVLDIRLPSLQGNTRRRFCYIQYGSGESAARALELDGRALSEDTVMQVRISNPNIKENRKGAQEEGREVIIRQLHWNTSEIEVQTIFAKIGKIEKVRILKKFDGKSKGVSFVTFAEKSDADAAVEALNGTQIRGRDIIVEIAEARAKRTMTVNAKQGTPGSREGSAAITEGQEACSEGHEASGKNKKERSIALLNVQDTVSAARLQKLVEQHGTIQRLSLRPDHGGAIVEFTEEKTVGLASLQLDGQELDGLKIKIGTVEELLASKPIHKGVSKAVQPKKPGETTKEKANPFGSGITRRPRVIGSQAGRKAGLGSKFAKKSADDQDQEMQDAQTKGKKSNADFRALIMGASAEAPAVQNGDAAKAKTEDTADNSKPVDDNA